MLNPPSRLQSQTATPVNNAGIGRASAFLASGTIVSRILGFVKLWVLAQVIGLFGQSTNAFAVANQLPNTVYIIVAGGVLTAVLVPQIVRAALHADGGTAYINKLLTVALVILGATTVVATLLAPVLTPIWGSNLSPETLALAIAFAYWCLPQIFFYGLYTVLGEVLNARKSFGPYTWVPVLNNVVAIIGLGIFALMFGADPTGVRQATDFTPQMIAVLAGSATLGVLVQAVVLYYFWRRIGLRYQPDFRWRGVGLGTAGKMAGWTFGMLILTTIAGIVETQVATIASTDSTASVQVLNTAWLIFMLPHSVITVSVATAYFTRMSEHASVDKLDLVRADASSAIRGTSLIIVIASAVIMVCAYPFAAVFVSKEFVQVQATGNVIIAYVLGLVAFCVLFIIQRTFYALSDTRTPFFFTLFQSALIVIGVLACQLLPVEWIAAGIALVVTVSGIAQALFAAFLLRPKIGGIDGRRIVRSLTKYFVAAIIPVALGIVVLSLLGGTREGGFAVSGVVSAIISMIAIGLVMSLTYFGILLLMRTQELQDFLQPVLSRLKR
jgi:putative peptidoglycan lipid II flippase